MDVKFAFRGLARREPPLTCEGAQQLLAHSLAALALGSETANMVICALSGSATDGTEKARAHLVMVLEDWANVVSATASLSNERQQVSLTSQTA
jgi:hypothetical protein